MRRTCVTIVAIIGLSISGPAMALGKGSGGATAPSGAAAVVQAWATALQAKDVARLQSMMAGDVEYSQLALVGSTKVKHWGPGGITPALFLRNAEVRVAKVRSLSSGAVVGILTQIAEGDSVHEWETWVHVRSGGAGGWQVAHITDVAMEGSFPGQPEGCPETSAKRHESITLYGHLNASGDEQVVRVFQTRRDTDAWAFASGQAKDEQKKCAPRPGLALEDLEVVVQEPTGALRGYDHLGRIDRTTGGGGHGIALYDGKEGGPLVSGGARLYSVSGSGAFLFLARTWMSEKTATDWRAVHRVDAYRWDGHAFHKLWGFDFGKEGGGLGGDTSGRVFWSLAAPSGDGIIHGSATAPCNGSVSFAWSNGGFKAQKTDVSGGCLGSWWPGGESGVLGMGEVNLEHLAKKAVKQEKGDE